ncbi:Putative adhesin [Paenibacillaceae bacterium GAS479]|nr:Putative adhesin [Paenibacillaceae bacterium GAS479]
MSERTQLKSRKLSALFAALLPGGGHLYLGWYGRGLMILLLVLLDLAALVRFSDSTSGSRALLLLYLGYALPAMYFFSVFDALEISTRNKLAGSNRDSAGQFTPTHSILLVAGGILLFFLIRPTAAVQPRLDWIGDMASGVVLLVFALWFGIKRKAGLFRLGRFSAAVILAVCGTLLLWDQVKERNDIGLLLDWWPLLFVLAGLEMLLFQLLEKKNPGRRLLAGIGSLLTAFIFVSSAYLVTQYGGLPFRWLDQYAGRTNLENLSEEKGFQFAQEPLELPLEEPITSVVIDNPNGDVTVQASSDPDFKSVIVESELWVDTELQSEADTVKEKSKLKLSSDGKLELTAQGMPYGANGSRLPRYNLVVTLPADLAAVLREPLPSSLRTAPLSLYPGMPPATMSQIDVAPDSTPAPRDIQQSALSAANAADSENLTTNATTSPLPSSSLSPEPSATPGPEAVKLLLNAGNGRVILSGLIAQGGMTLKNMNGSIELRNLKGNVEADTSSGNISAERLEGDVQLSARDGGINVSRIEGGLSAYTSNGNLDIADIVGEAILETKNGYIHVEQVTKSLQADTLNGEIRIRSSKVGGNWNIDSSIGEVSLSLPTIASFEMDGAVTFGTITSELPLKVTKKTIEGIIGLGTHQIRVDANSDISIFAFPSLQN